MMKKFLVLFLILLFAVNVFSADAISSYSVKSNVFLNQPVTAFGIFSDDANVNGNTLCSFYLLDSSGVLVDRADDGYTDASGRFSMSFVVTEPNFDRDSDYNVTVVCGEATDSDSFVVGNFESIADSTAQNFEFVTDSENVDTLLIVGFILFLLFAVILVVVGLKKFGGSL